MGKSKYLESLSQDEYKALTEKLWDIQNHKCFICEEEIDLDLQPTNIDHIKPLANNGKDEESNFAITHESCNKSKQDADLEIAKRLERLKKIIKKAEEDRETPSLKHVLREFGGSVHKFKFQEEEDKVRYSFSENGDNTIRYTEVFVDKLSGEKSAFIKVPIEYLYHDEIINPRGINNSISLLIKEFAKPNPQLHLSLARFDDDRIKIFDGQHKAVAQLILGVRELVVRLFLDPDVDRLIETNTVAGSKLKQIAFDKAIVRQLHDTLYAERIKKYQEDHNLPEDNFSFSEADLVDYFKGERGNIRSYVVNSQKNLITRNAQNKLQSYINFEGRGSELPLSYSTFEKTILATFVNAKTILTSPIDYKTDEGENPRILEKDQLVRLCNIIAEELLIGKYDINIGTYRLENKIAEGKGTLISDDHLVACRLFKEEVMYNWVIYLKLVVNQYFAVLGDWYNEGDLFQQVISDQLWTNITNYIQNLRDLPIWRDRSMAATIFGGKQNYDFWKTIFQTAKTPDGKQVLANSINVVEMIKR